MSFPERPCDTFRRTKIKDCNDIKALASDGGKCFLKFIKKNTCIIIHIEL